MTFVDIMSFGERMEPSWVPVNVNTKEPGMMPSDVTQTNVRSGMVVMPEKTLIRKKGITGMSRMERR